MAKKVVIGIVIYKNKILIVKRKVGEGNLLWQFPGGETEDNESEEDTIERELIEETGLVCKAKSKIGERFHPYTKRYMSYWECEFIDGHIMVGDNDLEEVKWVSVLEINKYFTTDLFDQVKKFIENKSH